MIDMKNYFKYFVMFFVFSCAAYTMNAVNPSIEQISSQIDKMQNRIDDLERKRQELEELKEEQESMLRIMWLAVISGGISMTAFLYFNYSLRKRNRRLNEKFWRLEKTINSIILGHNNGNAENGELQNKEIKKLNERIQVLEKTQQSLRESMAGVKQVDKIPHKDQEPKRGVIYKNQEYVKEGYFGINKQKYFNEFYAGLVSEKCVFRVWLDNEDNGIFEIQDLKRIISNDSIRDAIEFEGCSRDEALSFDVIESGRVKKYQKDLWAIESPLKIRLKANNN